MRSRLVLVMIFSGCVSSADRPLAERETDELVDDAIKGTHEVFGAILQELKKDRRREELLTQVKEKLDEFKDSARLKEVEHFLELYLQTKWDEQDQALFYAWMKVHPSAALRLATVRRRPEFRNEVGKYIDSLVANNREETLFNENFCRFVSAYRLQDGYDLMRLALEQKGEDCFARTMIELDPLRASHDFLAYLAKVEPEELRQLNQKSVNMFTALMILQHLTQYPPSMQHHFAENLLYYASSRNRGFAELALEVVNQWTRKDVQTVALMIVRQPVWLQMSLVEEMRRSGGNASTLQTLARVARDPVVIEEAAARR